MAESVQESSMRLHELSTATGISGMSPTKEAARKSATMLLKALIELPSSDVERAAGSRARLLINGLEKESSKNKTHIKKGAGYNFD